MNEGVSDRVLAVVAAEVFIGTYEDVDMVLVVAVVDCVLVSIVVLLNELVVVDAVEEINEVHNGIVFAFGTTVDV